MLWAPLPCVPPQGHGVMLHMVQTPPPQGSQPGKGHPKENPSVRDRHSTARQGGLCGCS